MIVSINSTTPFGGFIHVVILPFKVALTATSHIMTKSEFQKLQVKAASSGTTLTEFLRSEGVAYSTYNYWCKKLKAEAAPMPIAPISIRKSSGATPEAASMSGVELPGVTLAFPNGVRAHFGRGSEAVLMEVLSQIMM